MRDSVAAIALLLATAAFSIEPEQFREEDLPDIFRELSERHARIERFSKELAKQTNANRESSILQSAMLPRPPIDSEPIDNRLPTALLPDLPERSTVATTIDTGHTDYETESVIASPPPPSSSDSEERKFLLSEQFFKTSTNQPRARAAPTMPSLSVVPLSTPAVEESTTTEAPTSTFPTTTPSTTPREEIEEETAATVTLPSVRRTTPLRALRPLSFPPLPKFLPTRRNALPERVVYDQGCC